MCVQVKFFIREYFHEDFYLNSAVEFFFPRDSHARRVKKESQLFNMNVFIKHS